jgi:hypothetical protein
MYIAHTIFRFEDTFLQIAASPVKVVVVGASDSVMVIITSATVVGVT